MKNKKLITTYLILISFSLFSVSVYAKTLMIGDDNADITHFFGKVGIGTATPGAELDVNGAANFITLNVGTSRKLEYTNDNNGITKKGDSGGWAFGLIGAKGSDGADLGGFGAFGGGNSLVRWFIGEYSSNERMSILSSGNVGIGTTNPTSKLDVAGTGNFTGTVTVGTPTADGHATNRSWVQSYVAGSSGIGGLGSTYVNQTGDTMSGILNMGNNAITNINWSGSDDGSGSGLDADTIDGHNYSTNWETTGDITGITNGTGITGGCTSGTCTLNATLGTQITEDEIAQNTLDDSEIQDNSLTAGSLAPNSVGNSELIDSPTFTGITSGTGNFSGTLAANNGISIDGHTVIDNGAGWHRSYGNTGWYNNTYGGGWYMTDTSWIRAYNNKGVYSSGEIRSGGNMKAPIFYDLNNTGYYVNPASNSNLNTATFAGTVTAMDFTSAGGKNIVVGDDTYLTDVDVANILGVYGNQNSDRAGIRLGSDGGYIFGDNGNIGIGTTNPQAKLEVNGTIIASTPTADNEVATKGYVDAASGGGGALTCTTVRSKSSNDTATVYCPSGYTRTGCGGYCQFDYDPMQFYWNGPNGAGCATQCIKNGDFVDANVEAVCCKIN